LGIECAEKESDRVHVKGEKRSKAKLEGHEISTSDNTGQSGETSSSDTDGLWLDGTLGWHQASRTTARSPSAIQFRIAWRRMCFVVFETVQVLVALTARLALVRFFLLHSQGTLVGNRSLRVDNREGTIGIVMESLVVVTVLSKRLIRPLILRDRHQVYYSDLPICDT
jgi:hypothetical protein